MIIFISSFVNLGNTCYFNSALQLLLNIDEFKEKLKNYKNHSKTINYLFELNEIYNSNQNKVLDPTRLKNHLGSKKNIFKNFNQEDSSEFIILLFDIINNELSNKTFEDFLKIHSISSIKCKNMNCLRESNKKNTNLFLHLTPNIDLTTSYRQYKEYEKLEDDNKYDCENCKKLTVARKKIVISRWPKNLLILFNKYTNNLRKNNNSINIPILWRHNYQLVGGIVHSGGLNGGNYFYFGRKNNKWYEFNDSTERQINSEDEFNNFKNNAYILHYKM